MTTTAFDDQFTPSTQTIEIVHAPYEPVAILKRNVAELELALKRQTERAEKTEAELARLREQEPVAWCDADGDFYSGESYPNVWPSAVPLYAAPVPAPAVLAVPDGDDFNGSTPHLIQCMEALVRLDADGVLVPHGIGRDASKLLSAAANRLRQQAASSMPEEWRKVMARLLDTFERCEAGFHPHVEIRLAVRDEARALLQSAWVTK